MNLILLFVCFSMTMALHANDFVMTIDSNVADYNGNMITLSGHVIVQHEIGKICADNVEITPDVEEKSPHFLKMRDNVEITLADGGQLTCAIADIDYTKLEGLFEGNDIQEFVIYTEKNAGTLGNAFPLIVKSRSMTVQLADSNLKTDSPSRRCINSIAANNNVTIHYQNDFTALADFATYQRLEPKNKTETTKQMTGLLSLRAQDENGQCQVVTRRGDIVKASHICIDTIRRQLLFAFPKGALGSVSSPHNRIDFSSDTLTWDAQKNILTLRENVIVNQQGIGVLTNDQEIQLHQQVADTGKQLKAIESIGTTVLTFVDEDRQLSHTLTCYGKACVNHVRSQTTMDSPRDASGNVLEGKQVTFKDKMGDIFADKLTVDYTIVDNTPIPTHLLLEGDVRIFGHHQANDSEDKTILQFAIADIAEYSPQAKELTLISTGNDRVLFYDRTNALQVSATKLKVRRDQATNKESVQGFGDVRFSFVQKELDEMKKHFPLD